MSRVQYPDGAPGTRPAPSVDTLTIGAQGATGIDEQLSVHAQNDQPSPAASSATGSDGGPTTAPILSGGEGVAIHRQAR